MAKVYYSYYEIKLILLINMTLAIEHRHWICCRSAYQVVLKTCKLLLTAVGHAHVQVVAIACNSDSQVPPVTASVHNHAVVLQQALHHIPNPNAECMTRNVAMHLGQNLGDQVGLLHVLH